MVEEKLSAFSRKHLQDALNVLAVMQREGITEEQIRTLLKGPLIREMPVIKKARRLSRKQREREFKLTRWGRRRR